MYRATDHCRLLGLIEPKCRLTNRWPKAGRKETKTLKEKSISITTPNNSDWVVRVSSNDRIGSLLLPSIRSLPSICTHQHSPGLGSRMETSHSDTQMKTFASTQVNEWPEQKWLEWKSPQAERWMKHRKQKEDAELWKKKRKKPPARKLDERSRRNASSHHTKNEEKSFIITKI